MIANVAAFLDEWAEKTPEKPAIVFGERVTTFAELRTRVAKLAGALRALGLDPGVDARVFVLDRNCAATIELLLAAAWARIGCVIGNFRLAPDEIAWTIADSGASVVFTGEDFGAAVDALRPKLPAVTKVIALGDPYEAFVASAAPIAREPHEADDCVLQLYTSGTTGFPKGAMLTHRSLGAHTENMVPLFEFTDACMNLVPMPLFHVGGACWSLLSLRVGATSVVARDPIPKLLLETIAKHRITHTFLVPALLQAFQAMPDFATFDTSSLDTVIYGASPIAVPLLEKCLATMTCRFVQVYGMTEMSGVFCALSDEAHRDRSHPERLASAGQITPGTTLRVVDPATGEDVPPGGFGELWVKSEQRLKGYWNQPEATAAAITSDGWLKTGDAGIVDEGGFVFIQDRIKDMVISGGENVYPAEVERVLQTHPAVADVAVFGVPDEKWGETLRAAVVLAPDASVSSEELRLFCRSKLAAYKSPTQFDFVTALPRNPSGKVLKRELRAPFWQGRERKI